MGARRVRVEPLRGGDQIAEARQDPRLRVAEDDLPGRQAQVRGRVRAGRVVGPPQRGERGDAGMAQGAAYLLAARRPSAARGGAQLLDRPSEQFPQDDHLLGAGASPRQTRGLLLEDLVDEDRGVRGGGLPVAEVAPDPIRICHVGVRATGLPAPHAGHRQAAVHVPLRLVRVERRELRAGDPLHEPPPHRLPLLRDDVGVAVRRRDAPVAAEDARPLREDPPGEGAHRAVVGQRAVHEQVDRAVVAHLEDEYTRCGPRQKAIVAPGGTAILARRGWGQPPARPRGRRDG